MTKRRILIVPFAAGCAVRCARKKNVRSDSRSRAVGRWRATLIAACVALIFGCGLYFAGCHSVLREDASFTVHAGASVGATARELSGGGFIASESVFKLTVMGFGGRIQAGVYDIPANTGMWRIAKMMARGQVASTLILIPEGMTVRQIADVLDANRFLTGVSCVPHEIDDVTDASDASAKCPRDGELFPDTYRVAKGTPRRAVIDLMRKKMKAIEDGWTASGGHAPHPLKDWNEVVTLASIVQKETPRVSEMPTVASVYLNRLRKKMRLQADPTVVYALTNGLGDIGGKVLWTNQLKFISPYNTYLHPGLPPRPIANIGADAIAAVLNPEDTTYLFFVADGTGGHAFAQDYEEHQKNHATWRTIKKSRR
jgi:UPF0755 protein